MQKTQDTKRIASGLGWALGGLVVMLYLLSVTEAAPSHKERNGSQTPVPILQKTKRGRKTVHLQTAAGLNGQKFPALHEKSIYIWQFANEKTTFKLEDCNTTLIVPKNGLYFVNLKMYYRIAATQTCKDKLALNASIEAFQHSYPQWTDVIKGRDMMQCVDNWSQSVTLSQVVRLDSEAKLRVRINPYTFDYVDGSDMTYFSVTLL